VGSGFRPRILIGSLTYHKEMGLGYVLNIMEGVKKKKQNHQHLWTGLWINGDVRPPA